MTRMASDPESFDEEPSRSIFAAFWFRAVLVVIALGIVAVIAVPYVLDMMSSRPRTAVGPVPRATTPTPAPTPTPSAPATPAPAPSAPAPAVTTPPATAPSPTESAKTEPAKPEAPPAAPTFKAPEAERSSSMSPVKPDGAAKVAAAKPAAKPAVTRSKAASGPYWVQVGAFRDAASAKQVADALRALNYNVEETTKSGGARAASSGSAPAASPGADRYNVFVSGATPAEVNAKVGTKGFSADAVAGGVAVKPSLSLKEAVDLSRELAGEGMKVQVRRAAAEGGAAKPAPAPAATGETWYRVRVGSFPDRAAADAVLKELEGKGYKPFLARGAR
jgi:cell division septation protein DedD